MFLLWDLLKKSSQPVLILFLRGKDISHCQIHAYQTSSVPKEPKSIKKKNKITLGQTFFNNPCPVAIILT